MKRLITFILLLCSAPLFAQIDSLLADSLQRMVDKDKYVRQQVEKAFKKYGKDSPQWKTAWDNVQRTDMKHNEALKNVLDKLNLYPSSEKVGEEGAHNFWQLVLHQDMDTAFQMKVVAWMKIPVDQQLASPNDYAYLIDRIKVNTGRKQIYGTQCMYDNVKKKYVPHPIENPSYVDERRREMQLPPLSEYLNLLNDSKKKETKKKK